jgi:hypothetical protein
MWAADRPPTRGWINGDNSPSIVCARIPFLLTVLTWVGANNNPSAKFIRFARENEIKYVNATRRIPLGNGTADKLPHAGALG